MVRGIVENTDLSGRVLGGIKSLNRWHYFETVRLAAVVRMAREELSKQMDPARRAEFQAELENSLAEQRKLELGWENSSLRRRLTPEKNEGNYRGVGGVESRLLSACDSLSPAAGPAAERRGKKNKLKLTGHAAVFDKPSLDLGGFIEVIRPGAFADALKTSDVRALINHDPNLLLGRSTSKSLRLYEDRIGLLYYVDMLSGDNVSEAIVSRVAREDITGCSFSFIVAEDTWQLAQKFGQLDKRIITKFAELFDVGPVTYPAYPDTTVAVLDERMKAPPDAAAKETVYDREWFLREQDAEDEILMQEIGRQSRERKKEIERGYRLAGRIINRNKPA